MRQTLLLIALGVVSGSLLSPVALSAQEGFPHDRHSLFFSDCSVCHGGITAGAPADPYPEFSFCAACHDGSTAPSISWERPEPRASNLGFDHTRHDFGCSICHLPGGEEDLSQLGFPQPETCLGCHAPDVKNHLEAEQCDFCHVPVVESRLDQSRISKFPMPGSHQAGDFSVSHGALAAERAVNCATCHDRPSCTTCHGGATHLPDAVLEMPNPRPDGPAGVQITREGGSGFHPQNFALTHSAAASTGQMSCTTCHAESSCLACHDGLGSPSFHPLNFMASHGPEAYGRVSDCTSCHNSEAFCRECHLGSGIQGGSDLVSPFHDGQALWILSHPQAARQDLESCVTCHQQNDCMRCHSATSGLRMNPHGPDFDASSMGSRNKAMCALCHLPGAVGGGP
ncbi:MAG: hypothetical protein MUO50_19230 [Longimicrobiales bacterium]|nr:hypothetical protein [Longimicrobiales bacterium]